jgi:hypothetical protein
VYGTETVISSMVVTASTPMELQVLALVNNVRSSGARCGSIMKH